MNHVPVNELPYCKPVKKWLMGTAGMAIAAALLSGVMTLIL